MKKFVAIVSLLFISTLGHGQLFDHEDRMALVQKGIDYIYNVQTDSANLIIAQVAKELPDHPAVPMMRALNVLWTNIPVVTIDSVFREFSNHLQEVIRLSIRMDGGRQEHPEAIFFEMSARGLLAEYYADDGHYMKALNEASKAYYLVKAGFKLSNEVPEFLLTTGIYNYFREKYPERHPIYKPLLWFFKSGDVELGLQQMKEATQKAVLSRVEAYVYLAYVYLRYEYKPQKAQSYLKELNRRYPQNPYIQAKYLESLTPENDFVHAPLAMIKSLADSERPYYRMAGQVFWGLYKEKVTHDTTQAIQHYRESIAAGNTILDHGEYYRSLAYLGLGRVYTAKNQKDQAIYNLSKSLTFAETQDVIGEANTLLEQIQ